MTSNQKVDNFYFSIRFIPRLGLNILTANSPFHLPFMIAFMSVASLALFQLAHATPPLDVHHHIGYMFGTLAKPP